MSEPQQWELPPPPQIIMPSTNSGTIYTNQAPNNPIVPTQFTVPDGNFSLIEEDGWDSEGGLIGSRGPVTPQITEEELWGEMQGDAGTEPGDVWIDDDYDGAKQELDYVEANILGMINLLESLELTDLGRDKLNELRRALTTDLPEQRQALEAEHLGAEEAAASNPYCTGKLNSVTGAVEHWGRCNVHGIGIN